MVDTIAAIATAQAVSAIAILRLSGPDAASVAGRVFKSDSLTGSPRMMKYGSFIGRSGDVIDNGLAVYMKAPNSYTGEDTVELFCHGSIVVAKEILECLYAAGARAALPGEFTRRAFLNGKLELSQAEAVIDLIDSETIEAATVAAAQMEGHMGKKIGAVCDVLLNITSAFYAYVDYPDEEIEDRKIAEISEELNTQAEKLSKLGESFRVGKIIKDGVSCALVWIPNAGKSSILNALLGFERSIVSDVPGTTRDTVEEKIRIGNVVLHMIDTAGLHNSNDKIEKIGIERTKRAIDEAELVLAVFDGAKTLGVEDDSVIEQVRGKKTIAIVNKSDLEVKADTEKLRAAFGENICIISAKENSGFDELRDKINALFENVTSVKSSDIITNARHAAAIAKALDYVLNAKNVLDCGLTPDIAIADLENAINALGEITGQTADEQILSRIFERFCVGK